MITYVQLGIKGQLHAENVKCLDVTPLDHGREITIQSFGCSFRIALTISCRAAHCHPNGSCCFRPNLRIGFSRLWTWQVVSARSRYPGHLRRSAVPRARNVNPK